MKGTPPCRPIDLVDALYEGKHVFFRYFRAVRDLMILDPQWLTSDRTVEEALTLLENHPVRHIPIVESEYLRDEEPHRRRYNLIGIISRRDLTRALSANVHTPAQTEADDRTLALPLQHLMTPSPLSVNPDTGILATIQTLIDEHIDCLPVVEGDSDELVGMITTPAIIKSFVQIQVLLSGSGKESHGRLIDFMREGSNEKPVELLAKQVMGTMSDLMEEHVVTVKPEANLETAIDLINRNKVRHLLAVDDKGELQGILSDHDILELLPPRERPKGIRGSWTDALENSLEFGDNKQTKETLAKRVSQVMNANPKTVTPDTPLYQLPDLIFSHRLGAFPVVSGTGKTVVGIVTQSDILKGILLLGRLCTAGEGLKAA